MLLLGAVSLAAGNACGGRSVAPVAPVRPLRGVVLISIDALRADALGVYGSERPTTPFLDHLATSSLVFDNAFCQIPSTLPSHMSMFTGLYPSEHGVFPPSDVLSADIPTLPELFRAAGFRTFGHSEGGYVQGGYGFSRGFDEWSDTPYASDRDVERTFQRGLDSLAGLASGDRFFLFLHTYTVHDPYEPPDEYRRTFWPGPPPPGAFEATGPNFAAYNSRLLDAPPELATYYRALYDAGVRYLDDVVAHFFAELERLGLADDTLVVFTADHGEEFLDHGRYVHTQAYPETLHVPLVVHDPRRAVGQRVERLVETIDLLPTLAELTGWTPPAGLSGESFGDLWRGGDPRLAGRAYAQDEMLARQIRTLEIPVGGKVHQLYAERAVQERDGFWAARSVSFDATPPAIEFRAVAYHRPRKVKIESEGRQLAEIDVGTEWRNFRVELPLRGKQTVSLTTPECDSPAELGQGTDRRCLSFKVDGLALGRIELFDLAADPRAQHDISAERDDLVRTLLQELRKYPEKVRARSGETELSDEQVRQLKALGYLQ